MILELYPQFSFAILPCDLKMAANAIRSQGSIWQKGFVIDEACHRDIRLIYSSPDGPHHMPAINKGIMLSETEGSEGTKTIFISSVSDGYSSMLNCISKVIPGVHFHFKLSRLDIKYPGNFMITTENGEKTRVVYSMLDSKWVFFEKGTPRSFEDIGAYDARRKKDRFTPDIISSYLQRIGYGSLSKDFWIDKSIPAHLLATEHFTVWRSN